jgi:serine/threonine-protein kinase RIO1
MTHITTRTWMPEDLEKLRRFVEAGVSPNRVAVHFKRSIAAVKQRAYQEGFPFPDMRDVKRQRSKEAWTQNSLGVVDETPTRRM